MIPRGEFRVIGDNRVPYLDFCGLFGGDLGLPVHAAYLAPGRRLHRARGRIASVGGGGPLNG